MAAIYWKKVVVCKECRWFWSVIAHTPENLIPTIHSDYNYWYYLQGSGLVLNFKFPSLRVKQSVPAHLSSASGNGTGNKGRGWIRSNTDSGLNSRPGMCSWTRKHANDTGWLDFQLKDVWVEYPLCELNNCLLLIFSITTTYYNGNTATNNWLTVVITEHISALAQRNYTVIIILPNT